MASIVRVNSPPRSYLEVRPDARLARDVECYWLYRAGSDGGAPRRILPDGCMDLLFDLDRGDGRVVGTMTRAQLVPTGPGAALVGVRFRPGRAPSLLSVSARESLDTDCELHALSPARRPTIAELAARLTTARSDDERRRLLDRALLANAAQVAPAHPVAARAIARLVAAHGGLRIAPLARELNVSERQLERLVTTHVGVSPKQFARIVRLRALVTHLTREPSSHASPSWVDLALQFGYADQAHLAREFRVLAGTTLTAWAREQPMSDSFKTALA